MKKRSRMWYVVIGLLLLALGLGLRLWQLDRIPAMLNRDEAALGYNARLLHDQGKDEWGLSWPIVFESFGDFKLPGYIWALVGIAQFAPLTDAWVRLPSVLGSLVIVSIAYPILRQLKASRTVAFMSALALFCTPIFFFYGRIGFEAILGLAFFLLTWYCLNQGQWRWLTLALFSYAAACLTYNTPLLLLPFLLISWWWQQRRTSLKFRLSGSIALLAIAVTVWSLIAPVTSQKQGITLFSDETTHQNFINYRLGLPPAIRPLVGNRFVYWSGLIAERFIASWGPYYLVIRGGMHQWHQLPGFSHLTWSLYIFGWVGVIVSLFQLGRAVKKKKPLPELPLLLLFWLGASLAPSSITVDAPHATRSLLFFWWWGMAVGLGITHLTTWFHSRWSQLNLYWLKVGCLAVIALEFGWYLTAYFQHYPQQSTAILDASYRSLIAQVEQTAGDRSVAVVDPAGYQYILTAWYAPLSPQTFLNTIVKQLPNSYGFRYGERVGRYHFIAHRDDRKGENWLIEWDKNEQAWKRNE